MENTKSTTTEPVFVNLLRSLRIDSQPCGIDSLESIPGLLKCLQIRALSADRVKIVSIKENQRGVQH